MSIVVVALLCVVCCTLFVGWVVVCYYLVVCCMFVLFIVVVQLVYSFGLLFVHRKSHSDFAKITLCRYEKGERFDGHYDGCFPRNHNERSFITLQVYLNQDFTGGTTRFWDPRLPRGVYDAVPETGMAIFFFHEGWLHSGTEVKAKRKYVIRSDVMFRRVSQD